MSDQPISDMGSGFALNTEDVPPVTVGETNVEEEEKSNERTTTTWATIWTWVKAKPVEAYVMFIIFVAMVFSLTTFAADDEGYWASKYSQEQQQVIMSFGYRKYKYKYKHYLSGNDNATAECTHEIAYTNPVVSDLSLTEFVTGVQAIHGSLAFLGFMVLALKMLSLCDRLPEILDPVSIKIFSVGSSCICVVMMIVFVILVHSELKKWLNPIKICVDYSNWIHLSSAWAYDLTVIVIGLWISSVIILLCYPFWGEQDEEEDLLLPSISDELSRSCERSLDLKSLENSMSGRKKRPPSTLHNSPSLSTSSRYRGS